VIDINASSEIVSRFTFTTSFDEFLSFLPVLFARPDNINKINKSSKYSKQSYPTHGVSFQSVPWLADGVRRTPRLV
jgi:hypothetical protein